MRKELGIMGGGKGGEAGVDDGEGIGSLAQELTQGDIGGKGNEEKGNDGDSEGDGEKEDKEESEIDGNLGKMMCTQIDRVSELGDMSSREDREGDGEEREEEMDGKGEDMKSEGGSECEGMVTIYMWADGNKLGSDRWDSVVINNNDKLILEWPDNLDWLKKNVEMGLRPDGVSFWYAKWGDDAVVATRRGTKANENMKKIKRLLMIEIDKDLEFYPEGEFKVMEGSEMETQWEQEMINLAHWRRHDEEEIQEMLDGKDLRDEALEMGTLNYTIVLHMDRGVVEYPDEIEWRRREMETERTSTGGWVFVRWDDWMIGVIAVKEKGNWECGEDRIGRMRNEKIGPDTDEYGEGRYMKSEEGVQILSRIMDDGKLADQLAEEATTWNFNEVIEVVGVGARGDGVLTAQTRFLLKERWEAEPKMRSEQIIECARIELRMFKMTGVSNIMKGANINVDFNEEEGDIWIRTREDRAGERRLKIGDLEKLCEMKDIVVGYRSEGKVKKTRVGNGSFRDLVTQIRRKAGEWGTSVCVWGARAKDVIEIDEIEKEVEEQQEDLRFIATGCLVFGFTKDIWTNMHVDEMTDVIVDRAKHGVRGGIAVKRVELRHRVGNGETICLGNLGMEGIRNERIGVLVEFVNGIEVGKWRGMGSQYTIG